MHPTQPLSFAAHVHGAVSHARRFRAAFVCTFLLCAACACNTVDGQADGDATSVPTAEDVLTGEAGGSFASVRGVTWPSTVHAQADAAVQALMKQHWGSDFFGTGWQYAQVLDLVVDNVARTGARRYAGTAQSLYWRINNVGYANYPGTTYFDDISWMALALMRLYAVSLTAPQLQDRAADYQATAYSFYGRLAAGEVFDAQGNSAGMWWDSAHTQKTTTGNGGAVLAGALLYEQTRDASALAYAKRLYAYWTATGCAMDSFTVNDHVDAAGSVTNWQFTYNYGVMVGAALALHRATGESSYLHQARGFAAKLIQISSVPTAQGVVLTESCGATCSGSTPIFKGIALRYLAQLAQLDPKNTAVVNLVKGSIQALAVNFDAASGHFPTDWTQPAGNNNNMTADIAGALAVSAVGAYAQNLPQASLLPLSYEAEDAELTAGLAIGAAAASSGWGVVSGWNAAAQTLRFADVFPYDGNYLLHLVSVAGPAKTSARTLSLAPGTYTDAIEFPANATGGAARTSVTLPLQAGQRAVTLSMAAAGNTEVPLDVMLLTPAPTGHVSGCGTATDVSLSAPVLGARSCGAPTFTWASVGGAYPAHDVVVDGKVVCHAENTSRCVAPATAKLTPGPHSWYLVSYDACGAVKVSPQASFLYAEAPPTEVAPTVTPTPLGLRVSWAASPPEAQVRGTVEINGVVLCLDQMGNSCSIQGFSNLGVGQNSARVILQNGCSIKQAQLNF